MIGIKVGDSGWLRVSFAGLVMSEGKWCETDPFGSPNPESIREIREAIGQVRKGEPGVFYVGDELLDGASYAVDLTPLGEGKVRVSVRKGYYSELVKCEGEVLRSLVLLLKEVVSDVMEQIRDYDPSS